MSSSSSSCSRCRLENEARTRTGLAGVPHPDLAQRSDGGAKWLDTLLKFSAVTPLEAHDRAGALVERARSLELTASV
jgi:hypothetical protein